MSNLTIFDGHNDTLLNLYLADRGRGRSFFARSDWGHIDLPRAREGGFGGGFFAIFTPSGGWRPRPETVIPTPEGYRVTEAEPVDHETARAMTLDMLGLLHELEREGEGSFRVVRTVDDIERALTAGAVAAICHIEGAEAIGPDLDELPELYAAGLRSLGIVWSRCNVFGSGVPFAYPASPDTGPGLTPIGRDLVRACNRLRMVIDLAHMNEQGFWDVAALSDAPLVVTHSAAHALCPSTRNLTDRQLDAIRESDGMVGVSFTVADLRPDGHLDADTPLDVLADHIVYLAERVGIDRVGLGSDFDGTTVPRAIGDVSGLPVLLETLAGRGFDEEELAKIAYRNWLRVLRLTWGG